jgi:integrase
MRGQGAQQVEQIRVFTVAQSKPKYRSMYVLLIFCHYCGMRPCESFGLKQGDINWQKKFLTIMRSKTPAGWRYPSLNHTCLGALQMLFDQAILLGIAKPDHHVFPYHPRGRFRKNQALLDPTRPMTKYARQWNEIRKEAGLEGFWFYDGRHTAFTQMQEAGLPDGTIRAQVGHTSAQVMKRYSNIRRQ